MSARKTGKAGKELIHGFEKCVLKAYPDPGSANGHPWTIGWGSTGPDVKPGTVWTQAYADTRFEEDLAKFELGVNQLVGNNRTTQNQFDALVSFAYNCGLDIDGDTLAEGLGDSTLLKKHNAGDHAGAAKQFAAWNKNDGQVMRGLVRRRAQEAQLYLTPDGA